jgi:hypothetical protein
MFILGIFNNPWEQIVNETIEWLGLCFIKKECKKHERNKIMYREICKIKPKKNLSNNKFDKIQIEKIKLNAIKTNQS